MDWTHELISEVVILVTSFSMDIVPDPDTSNVARLPVLSLKTRETPCEETTSQEPLIVEEAVENPDNAGTPYFGLEVV